MKKYFVFLLIIGTLIIQMSCGGASSSLTAPVGDNILVVGGILFENLTNTSLGRFETVESGIDIVIVGKNEQTGKIKGYQLFTDKNGYFFLENVPKSQFVVKGIRVMLEDQSTIRITNNWQTRKSAYYKLVRPEQIIDFNVQYFPKQETEGKILNLGLWYFGLEMGSIAHSIIPKLENQKLRTEKVHNRLEPTEYYKTKFPESPWFNM